MLYFLNYPAYSISESLLSFLRLERVVLSETIELNLYFKSCCVTLDYNILYVMTFITYF